MPALQTGCHVLMAVALLSPLSACRHSPLLRSQYVGSPACGSKMEGRWTEATEIKQSRESFAPTAPHVQVAQPSPPAVHMPDGQLNGISNVPWLLLRPGAQPHNRHARCSREDGRRGRQYNALGAVCHSGRELAGRKRGKTACRCRLLGARCQPGCQLAEPIWVNGSAGRPIQAATLDDEPTNCLGAQHARSCAEQDL